MLRSRPRRRFTLLETLEPRQLLSSAVTTVLSDNFNGSGPATGWTADVSYLGYTQLRAPLAQKSNGVLKLKLDTYNPTGFSFYGTGVVSDAIFTPESGKTLTITVRAKLDLPIEGGLVGGIFLYPVTVTPGLNNELDFELIVNELERGTNRVMTNVYADQPLGIGNPLLVTLPTASTLGDWHTYTMKLDPGQSITWFIDGILVRTETNLFPSGPMQLRMNLWAPAQEWAFAYNPDIHPVSDPAQNQSWSMSVDYAKVESSLNPVKVTNVSVNVSSAEEFQRTVITGSGTINATGYGKLKYTWMIQKPDGKIVKGKSVSVNVANSSVDVPTYILPNSDFGAYQAWIRIGAKKNVQDSNVLNYNLKEVPPTISITKVPPRGKWDVSLGGRVDSFNLKQYKVAVYIKVYGAWYTKPYWEKPVTSISSSGNWSCKVTTGGNDPEAEAFRAYLLPKSAEVPIGLGWLPVELNAYIYAEAIR